MTYQEEKQQELKEQDLEHVRGGAEITDVPAGVPVVRTGIAGPIISPAAQTGTHSMLVRTASGNRVMTLNEWRDRYGTGDPSIDKAMHIRPETVGLPKFR